VRKAPAINWCGLKSALTSASGASANSTCAVLALGTITRVCTQQQLLEGGAGWLDDREGLGA